MAHTWSTAHSKGGKNLVCDQLCTDELKNLFSVNNNPTVCCCFFFFYSELMTLFYHSFSSLHSQLQNAHFERRFCYRNYLHSVGLPQSFIFITSWQILMIIYQFGHSLLSPADYLCQINVNFLFKRFKM